MRLNSFFARYIVVALIALFLFSCSTGSKSLDRSDVEEQTSTAIQPQAEPQRTEETEPREPQQERKPDEVPVAQAEPQQAEETEPLHEPQQERKPDEVPAAQAEPQQAEETEPLHEPQQERKPEEVPAAQAELQQAEETEPLHEPQQEQKPDEVPAAQAEPQRTEETEPHELQQERKPDEVPAAQAEPQRTEETEPLHEPQQAEETEVQANEPELPGKVEIDGFSYVLDKPFVSRAFTWDLSAPQIRETKVEIDESEAKKRKLILLSLENADQSELLQIAGSFGISTSGDVKQNITEAFIGKQASEESSQEILEEVEESYNFAITSAQSIECSSLNDKDFIYIDGNVIIDFDLGGVRRTLKADSILFDVNEQEILAFGHISISSSGDNSQLQDLSSEILFLNFTNNKIRLTEAIGSTVKENNETTSKYFMFGKTIIFDNKTNEIFFDGGSLLPSSDVNNANWQIKADKIIMKSNGDVLLSWLLLKLGRVPILPLPAIFMPGTPLTINPSIGFSSTKGAFLNMTYELYGSYPGLGSSAEGSSLTNLFKSSTSGAGLKKKGFLYKTDTSGEKQENTASDYMALMLDVYQKEGFYFGVDTKNNFLDSKISLTGKAGVIYKPGATPEVFDSSTYRNFRYFVDLEEIKINNVFGFNLSLNLPFYSDPGIKSTYFNRFTAFNFDSIFGGEQKFPETYSGSFTESLSSMNLSFSLPSNLTSTYLSNLSISADIKYNRYWADASENNSDYYRFVNGSITLPSVTASMGGVLFSFTKQQTTAKEIKATAEAASGNLSPAEKRAHELSILRQQKADEAGRMSKIDGLSAEICLVGPAFKYLNMADEGSEELSEVKGNSGEHWIDNDEGPAPADAAPAESAAEKSEPVAETESKAKRYTATADISQNDISRFEKFFTDSHIKLSYNFSDTFSNSYARPENFTDKRGKKTRENSLTGAVTLDIGIGKNIFSIVEKITPNYTYSFKEDSNNYKSTEFTLKSVTQSRLNIPVATHSISIIHDLTTLLYSYKSTEDDMNPLQKEEKKIEWGKDFVSAHSLSGSLSFFSSMLNLSVTGNLPPLETATLKPSVSFSRSGFSISGSHGLKGPSYKELENERSDGRIGFTRQFGIFSFNASVSASYDFSKEGGGLAPFELGNDVSLNFFDGWLAITQKTQFFGTYSTGDKNYFSTISIGLSVKNYLNLNLGWTGVYDDLKMGNMTGKIEMPKLFFSFWKNRISISLGFSISDIKLNFEDAFQNSLKYSIDLGFDIREFIKITFSLSGANNNFLKYTGDSRHGKFNFGEFFKDILRGINVFSPEMASSNFKMDSLSIKVEHDMGDWDFSFTFTGKFEQNGNEFEWKPEYTINLHWAVIPELKIDSTIKNNNSSSNGSGK